MVIAGGPKCETEGEVFDFVHDGLQRGAIGINLGRNVWQCPHPVAMATALLSLPAWWLARTRPTTPGRTSILAAGILLALHFAL